MTTTPVLDADGLPVEAAQELLADGMPEETVREFFAGRVRAPECPHYVAASERRAGFRRCERC